MSYYSDIHNRIHHQMVPLPIPYRHNYSIDHNACCLAPGERHQNFV